MDWWRGTHILPFFTHFVLKKLINKLNKNYTSLWKKCVLADTEAETQTRKNFKFGSSLRFGPVRKGQNAFFP
jgi:hypothetical protein